MTENQSPEIPKFIAINNTTLLAGIAGLFPGTLLASKHVAEDGFKEYSDVNYDIYESEANTDALIYSRDLVISQGKLSTTQIESTFGKLIDESRQETTALVEEKESLNYQENDYLLQFIGVSMTLILAAGALTTGLRYGFHRYKYRNSKTVIDSAPQPEEV